MRIKKCDVCGKEFEANPPFFNKKYCGKECRKIAYQKDRKCIICGGIFKAHGSSPRLYCSDKCREKAAAIRKEQRKSRITEFAVPSWIRKSDKREKFLYLELPDRMSEKEKKEMIEYYRKNGLKAYRELRRQDYMFSTGATGYTENIAMHVPEVMI